MELECKWHRLCTHPTVDYLCGWQVLAVVMGGHDWFQVLVSAMGIPGVTGSDAGHDRRGHLFVPHQCTSHLHQKLVHCMAETNHFMHQLTSYNYGMYLPSSNTIANHGLTMTQSFRTSFHSMCSLWPFSLDTKQEDEDLHVVVEKSDLTVMINKENQGN